MNKQDYAPQEPLSDFGRGYQETCFALGAGVEGIDVALGEDPYRSLMVFPAARPNGVVLAWMFGGGWTNGYKEMMAFMAPGLNAQGITFVSLGYRLAPQNTFPTNALDAVAGLAWVYRHIAEHGGDSKRIFLGGHSAGAHQAALIVARRDWLAQAGLPAHTIQGVLPISGTYDFTEGNGLSMRPRFLGPPEQNNEVAASPLFHVGDAVPPFFIAWGEKDFPHLILQAKKFARVLRYRKASVETVELGGCGHLEAGYEAGKGDGKWLGTAVSWIRSIKTASQD